MLNGTYYLNNNGSRWINFTNGKRDRLWFSTKSGKRIRRAVRYYEAFGNFATASISYKGKIVNVFVDSILGD